MLKDTPCSMKVFDVLRQMNAVRQIEAADLMIGQHKPTARRSRTFYAYVRASDTRCHASQPVGRSQKDDRRCCIHAARPADCSHGKGTGSTS
ncbi:plasmid partitioning protein RepB C-terminal domain-containing protein, partial [Sinorhizobium meliloti]|uniref:plasmid partitioning protein RepB C-terminal domain-containing protein n=1 Tax=Rhizobium meliloti TaxID=382 RepID=UPI002E0DC1A9